MFAIELAKLPPPTPARQLTTSSVVNETPGSSTMAVAIVGRNSTMTDHRLQIEKPMCSEKIEKNRLRRATRLPVESQNCGSSGRQSSIHRPLRGGGGTGGAVVVMGARVGAG